MKVIMDRDDIAKLNIPLVFTSTTMPMIDVLSCSEEVFNSRNQGYGKKWREHGTNHRVLPNGYIARDTDTLNVLVTDITLKQIEDIARSGRNVTISNTWDFELLTLTINN